MSGEATELRVIVAVDDDEDDRFFFSRLLRKAGANLSVEMHAHGSDVIAALGSAPPGSRTVAIFLDVKMPEMTGFDLLRWIRDQPRFAAVPVLMLSSSDHLADLEQAKEMGAQCYLRKHPSVAEVQQLLDLIASAAAGEAVDWLKCKANLLRDGV